MKTTDVEATRNLLALSLETAQIKPSEGITALLSLAAGTMIRSKTRDKEIAMQVFSAIYDITYLEYLEEKKANG